MNEQINSSMIDTYNQLFNDIRNMQTSDILDINSRLTEYNQRFGEADYSACHRLNKSFKDGITVMQDMAETAYNEALSAYEEEKAKYYTPRGNADADAIQQRTAQLISSLPAQVTEQNRSRVNQVLNSCINENRIGAAAIIELCKMPAYSLMISEPIRNKAFELSKTEHQKAWEQKHSAAVASAEKKVSDAYLSSFRLRTVLKRVK